MFMLLGLLSVPSAGQAAPAEAGIVYGTGETVTGPMDLLGDLWMPEDGCDPAGCPTVILIHGGGFVGGSRFATVMQRMAEGLNGAGFAVFSIDYRLKQDQPVLSPAYAALLDRFDPGFDTQGDPMGPLAAMEDAAMAVAWIADNGAAHDLDTRRVGLLGSSAGAFTALGTEYLQDELGVPTALRLRGVVDLWGGLIPVGGGIDRSEAPLMIVHGDDDRTVPPVLGALLYRDALQSAVPVQYLPIAGAGHGYGSTDIFNRDINGQTVFQHITTFLSHALGVVETWCLSNDDRLCPLDN